MSDQAIALEPVKRMSIDLAKSAKLLSLDEARYLVDAYYMMQENRIRSDAQMRTLRENEEPHAVIAYLAAQDSVLENQIRRALDKWTDEQHLGRWAKSIVGIGPVIAAGLLAHIDLEPWYCAVSNHNPKMKSCHEKHPHENPQCGKRRTETVGHLWSFAGLNPAQVWNKGERRPFNATFKTLVAFKLGECFVKVQNNEADVYGKLFARRKREYAAKNDAGEYAGQCVAILDRKRYSKDTEAWKAYSAGKLPPAHIHARARRAAVKQFLSDYHLVAYFHQFVHLPPIPYVFAHCQGHSDYMLPPNLDFFPGLEALLQERIAKIREAAS